MKAEKFLTKQEQAAITDAIKAAELNTSGEIRVHIEDVCPAEPIQRAADVLLYLGMDKTEQRNGVLIYMACKSKVFAIVGDSGINDAVPDGFWDDVCQKMATDFKAGLYARGLIKAVTAVGEKLKTYFPYQTDDVNEQPDEISFGNSNEKSNE